MARWIGAVCGLLLVNIALAQVAAQPGEIPPPVIQVDLFPSPTPHEPLLPAVPPGAYPPGVQGIPVPPPPLPYDPQFGAVPPVSPPFPPPTPEPLEIVVYNVADLVVGQGGGGDSNQALLSMLAQQSEELAMALNAATAAGGGSQQHMALGELAETIKSTFAAEFNDERASITLHRNTMSLIVRQSESVHEQICDLLDQLRHANDTNIHVSIELVELDEARTPFAMAHNGQVLDDATAAEFRALAEEGEAERLKFNVTVSNGQSMNMFASGLPGTMTAVASHDRREVRLLMDMLLGLEMGLTQTFNHRIPVGESLLTIFSCEGCSYVVLLSAEINEQEELEDAYFGDEVAPATHVEEPPLAEPVSQTSNPQILTQALLVEIDSLPEDFLEQIIESFDGEMLPDSEPRAAVLESASGNDVVLAMQKDHFDMQIISRPQTVTLDGGETCIQVGQVVPVLDGIRFERNVIVPIARNQEVGSTIHIKPTAVDGESIELQLEATWTGLNSAETTFYEAPGQTVTAPVIDSVTARGTFTVPEGKTLVWPVPTAGITEAPTLLILLTSRTCDVAHDAE